MVGIVNFNKNKEAVNGDQTCSWIARQLKKSGHCLLGWNDGANHCDLIFVYEHNGLAKAGKIPQSHKSNNLFIATKYGLLSYEINTMSISPSHVELNLWGDDMEYTAKRLSELITGVKLRL